jgi:hypothetical protein
MYKLLCTSVLSLSLCAAACSSGDQSGAGGGATSGTTGSGGKAATPVPESEFAEQVSVAFCQLSFACGCAGTFMSKETCSNQIRAKLQTLQKAAQDQHLTYDAECTGKLLARLDARGCDAATTCDTDVCWPYFGTTTFGGGCEQSASILMSSCAQGSTCQYPNFSAQGECHEPCMPAQQQPQDPHAGQHCTSTLECGVGELCASETGVCTPEPKAGEPCLSGFICAAGLSCEHGQPNEICVPEPKIGESCSSASCAIDAYCDGNNLCAVRRADGEPCAEYRECRANQCTAGKCGPPPAICNPPFPI